MSDVFDIYKNAAIQRFASTWNYVVLYVCQQHAGQYLVFGLHVKLYMKRCGHTRLEFDEDFE